jgi:hypothetical protein
MLEGKTSVYSLMQTGQPYKSYRKTVLGKLYLTIWDSFTEKPLGYILEGMPNETFVDVWSELEDVFLRRSNKRHFELGYLVEQVRPVPAEVKSPNEVSNEELDKILNSKFLSLQSSVNKFTSVAPLTRLIVMAREQEKSEKILAFLEGKLSELQAKEYTFVQEEEE